MAKRKPLGNNVPMTPDIKALIAEAVEAGRQLGRQERSDEAPYKATEKRLYAYPILAEKVEADREYLERLKTHGTPERSRGIARLSKTGYRAAPEDMLDRLIQDKEAELAADEQEIATIEAALSLIHADPYYRIIPLWYFEGIQGDEISERESMEKTTVWRNRKRLVSRMVVRLYGAAAMK